MNEQSYRDRYVAAVDAANVDLAEIFEEAKQLQHRMEEINCVIDALKPLLSDLEASHEIPELNPTKQQIDATLGMVLV